MVEEVALCHGCACCGQVRAKDDHGAMHFARDILVRAAKTDVDYQELQDALSLMGYDDPAASPCGQMMSQHVSACSPILAHWLTQHLYRSGGVVIVLGIRLSELTFDKLNIILE